MDAFITLVLAFFVAMVLFSIIPYLFMAIVFLVIVIGDAIIKGYNYIIRKLYD